MESRKVVLLFSSFLICAVTAVAQLGGNPRFTNLQIHVQVRYANGTAASQGIAVTVEGEGAGVVAQAQTDSQGKANFSITRPGFYIVSVNQPGYERPTAQRVDLNTASSAYLIFELRPIPGAANVPPEGPGAQISANPKAVKEYQQGEKLLITEHNSEDSISHFRKAIKLDENFQPAYLLLGMALLDQRKASDAQSVLETAIKLDPKSSAAHLELGASYNQQKRFQEAEQELMRGLELNPGAAEGHYEIAKTYWQMGNVAQADLHAQKAASLRPDLAPVHVLLGNVALRKGDPQMALKEFREYLRLDPSGPMAEPVQQQINKITKAISSK